MALNKTITQENGIVTNYHKVTRVNFIDANGEKPSEKVVPLVLQVTVTSFLNEEFREAGHSINSNSYFFAVTNEEEETLGIRKLAYGKLKTLEVFAEAEDC
jgi:hypothetical protein